MIFFFGFCCEKNCFNGRRWNELMLIMNKVQQKAVERLSERDPNDELNSWIELGTKIEKIQFQLKHGQTFGFKFVEGALVRALQEGRFICLRFTLINGLYCLYMLLMIASNELQRRSFSIRSINIDFYCYI